MKTLIAGIGSPILADDGVGVHAVRRLRGRLSRAEVDLVEVGTAGLSLLDVVHGYERLILIDAIVSGAPPGTLHELREEEVTRTAHLGSSHEADLPTALALGREVMAGRMPAEVVVLAVEAADLTTFSEQLTPAVERALPEVVARVERLLGCDGAAGS